MLKLAWSTEAIEALRYWRFHHPHPLVQLKMDVVLLRSQGVSNEQIQSIGGISKATLYRYLHEYHAGGVERLKELHLTRQESALVHQRTTLEAHFRAQPPATVAAAAAAVAEFISRTGVSEDAAFGIDMAVREAVTNAVVHGNSQDEDKVVDIVLRSSPDAVEISVHDQGPGFNPNEVPDPTADENLLKTSGRGIFFMRSFMDEVDWFIRPEGGTTVRMLKRR